MALSVLLITLPTTFSQTCGRQLCPKNCTTCTGCLRLNAYIQEQYNQYALGGYLKHVQDLTEVSPFWYELSTDGINLDLLPGARNESFSQLARDNNVLVLPAIFNNFESERTSVMLSSPENRKSHIDVIMSEVKTYGYDGIDVDYENMFAEDRDHFTLFIEDLGKELHALNKVLSIAVHAKMNDDGKWNGPAGQDWVKLGKVVDIFRIMTYDYCWQTGCDDSWSLDMQPPGPISPYWWNSAVLDYAVATIENPHLKVELGVPLYGYDWNLTINQALSVVYLDIKDTISAYDLNVMTTEFDLSKREVYEHYIRYSNGMRVAYFADEYSVEKRTELAIQKGIRGLSFWHVGGEDPNMWKLFKCNSSSPLLVSWWAVAIVTVISSFLSIVA